MKNFILSLFIASFALASMAIENNEKCSKENQGSKEIVRLNLSEISNTGQEMDVVTKFAIFLNKKDRTSLSLTCRSYGEYVRLVSVEMSAKYQKEVGSLLDCESIFDLKQHHFTFFRHANKYFPEMFDTLENDLTAFGVALMKRNEIAATFFLVLHETGAHSSLRAYNVPYNDKIRVFEEHFKKYSMDGMRYNRWGRLKKIYNNGEDFLSPNFHELLDILVNCSTDDFPLLNPLETLMPIFLCNSNLNYNRHLELFIEAGLVCDVSNFPRADFKRFFNSHAWKIFLDKGLISKRAIAINLYRMVQEVLIYKLTVANSTLESFLSKYKGNVNFDGNQIGDGNFGGCQTNALTEAFAHTLGTPSLAMDMVRLLLAKGADPHYKLLGEKGGSKILHSSPITKLFEDYKRYVDADKLDLFMELLEECKKRNFVRADYEQWVGTNKGWIYEPRLYGFLIENEIDPLELFIKAGSVCDFAKFSEYDFNRFFTSHAWEIFLAKGLISEEAIAINLKHMVRKVFLHEKTVKNSTLESFLTKYKGDINFEMDQENALTVAFAHTLMTPSLAMGVVRLLLDKGANPHYKLLGEKGGSKIPHSSPIIKLLEDHGRYVKADKLDVFMKLLEECKIRKFVLADYEQWAGTNEDWIYEPRLYEFLIKNGIYLSKLFIKAGSVCDVANFSEVDFNRFFNSPSWKIFLDNGLISQKAIAINLKRMVGKVFLNEKTVTNSTLESFLIKYEGRDINFGADKGNALTVAFALTLTNPSIAMDVIYFLLANGADPHYKLLEEKDGKKYYFPPITKLLKDYERYVKADKLDVFMELLEECKKRNFVLDDYIQWARYNEDWIYQPRLCGFLIENGIDPLMACKGSFPLKYALDVSLSGSSFYQHSFYQNFDPRKSLDIMLSHCRNSLSANLFASILPDNIDFDEYFLSLVRNGLPFKVWAHKQNVLTWCKEPQICKHLIETGNLDPLMGDNLDSPIMRVLSYLGGSNSDSALEALEALEVMVLCCSKRLINNPLFLTTKQEEYLEKKGKLDFFLKNGFELSQINSTDASAKSLPPKMKEYLEKIGKLDYFLENGFELSQTNCTDVSAKDSFPIVVKPNNVLPDNLSIAEFKGVLVHYETPIASDVVDGKRVQKLDDIWILRFLMIPLLIMFYTSS